MTYIKARIDYQAQNSPSDHESRMNAHSETETFKNTDEALEWIKDRVNVENLADNGQNMYRDTKDGETKKIGKIYSYWKEYCDRQRGHYNVWETAWIEITEVEETPVDIEEVAE